MAQAIDEHGNKLGDELFDITEEGALKKARLAHPEADQILVRNLIDKIVKLKEKIDGE